jgi:hypothetical protein
VARDRVPVAFSLTRSTVFGLIPVIFAISLKSSSP